MKYENIEVLGLLVDFVRVTHADKRGVEGSPLGTPCLKLGQPPKIPHLPALGLKLQGPKLRHPERFKVVGGKSSFCNFCVFFTHFHPAPLG